MTEAPVSPRSKRWQTTTKTALEEVAEYMRGPNSPRSNPATDERRARKEATQSTQISFGDDYVDYSSNAMQQQKTSAAFDIEEREAQIKRNKAMKANLTKANFSLGDAKVSYRTTAREAMRVDPDISSPRVKAVAVPAQKSSITFGSGEAPVYVSVAKESMEYHGNNNNFNEMKEEVHHLKANLRKHNFSLGEDKVEYTSDHRRGYGAMDKSNYMKGKRNEEIKKNIEDTRKCHFSLGEDSIDYISNTHRSQKKGMDALDKDGPEDVAAHKENARKMKQQLQRTSIVVGFDDEYF